MSVRSYQKRLRSRQAFQDVGEKKSHDRVDRRRHGAGMFVYGPALGLAFWAVVIGVARLAGWL